MSEGATFSDITEDYEIRIRKLRAENERLREEHDKYVRWLYDGWMETAERADRFREALEALRMAAGLVDDRVIYGLADDALDGDGR